MRKTPISEALRPDYTKMVNIAKATGYEVSTLYKMHYEDKKMPYEVRVYLKTIVTDLILDLREYLIELERENE